MPCKELQKKLMFIADIFLSNVCDTV